MRVPLTDQDIIRANEAARDGDLAFSRKDYYAALIKFLDASRLNPNSEYIYNKLGMCYSKLQYYPQATDAYLHSIAMNPKYAFAYNNLGSVRFATSDKNRAEKYFRKAISLNPAVASFHLNLSSLLFEKKQVAKAMAEFEKGIQIDANALNNAEIVSVAAPGSKSNPYEKSYFMARVFARIGNAQGAVENLQRALNDGFTDIQAIRKERDFDPIREDQRFVVFMRTATLLANP